jgi:hypothetical protein
MIITNIKREYIITIFLLSIFYKNKILCLIYTIFSFIGYLRLPYTTAWWIIFILSLFINNKLLYSITGCCGNSLIIGYYGIIIYDNNICYSIINNCKDYIISNKESYICKKIPICYFIVNKYITLIIIITDIFIHLIPGIYVSIFYYNYINHYSALLSIPTNLIYFYSTKFNKLQETNKIYKFKDIQTNFMWIYVYVSHCLNCIFLSIILYKNI